jgi:hypothetical protein
VLILHLILILLLATTIFVAAYRFWKGDLATKIFIAILILSFVTQSIDTVYRHYGLRHQVIYRVSSYFELVLYCLYFNYSISSLRNRQTGWSLAIAGLIIGLGLEFISEWQAIGSPFLTFEGLLVIGLSIYAIYKLFTEMSRGAVLRNIHFWLTTCACFLWCVTLLSLALYDYFSARQSYFLAYLTRIIWVGDYVSLTGMLAAFSFAPKPARAAAKEHR